MEMNSSNTLLKIAGDGVGGKRVLELMLILRVLLSLVLMEMWVL